MLLYVAMAFWAAIGWAFNARLASIVARAIAPTGAMFTFLALWTGALWGKPTWGTWWVWDARLTSELILLFLYVGYLALVSAIDDPRRADRAGALLAIVGSVNVPIIYFSVIWWNTLHQGASISMTTAPKMASVMLLAMLLMTLAFWAYAFAVVFVRARAIALERDSAGRLGERCGRRAHRLRPERRRELDERGEFFAMGGYAPYVWGAYAVTAALHGDRADARRAAPRRRARRALAANGDRPMKPRQKRLAIAAGIVAAVGVAAALVLNAFQSNLVFFYSPSQVAAHEAPSARTFRLGGMVEKGTLKRDGTKASFIVTDTAKSIQVHYEGILPDLFKEGKGVVAQGQLRRRRVRRPRGARQARRELHAARGRRRR